MRSTVYIETSVISYLTARPSRDLIAAAHQQITREWWSRVLPAVEGHVSNVVYREAARGDAQAAARRLEAIDGLPVLVVESQTYALAEAYAEQISLPDRAFADSLHLALAAYHGMDFLVTWNCRHIANGRIQQSLRTINELQGIVTPTICTPQQLMEV